MSITGEKTRFLILSTLLGLTCLTYYYIKQTPELIFVQDKTYYMPGKNKDCAWHVYFENDVYLKRGSFSNIYIGLPDRETRGVVKGIVESTGEDLLLAFSYPGDFGAPPVVLTAAHKNIKKTNESVRFKLLNSTLLTVLIYKNQQTCIKRYSK
jgi:hypothetical protein